MYLIQEQNIDGSTVYSKKYISLKEKNNYEIEINVRSVTINKHGFDNILIYDSDMNVIRNAYKYLNIEFKNKSINTRNKVASALKLLYSFMKIFNINSEDLKKEDLIKLKEFLYGDGKRGEQFEFSYMTIRSSDTINQYFSVYRTYLTFLGFSNKALNAKTVVHVEKDSDGLLGHTREKAYEKYTISELSTQNTRTVPMYIRPNEFQLILSIIRKEYSLRAEIMVRLMFENGLRLGEVLGLTLEDIGKSKIIIRNRLSDKCDQHAKTCIKPKCTLTYESGAYNTFNVGYQIIKPTYELLDKIEQYIDIIHGNMSETNRSNYTGFAKADKVSDGSMLEGDNYYLFLNKNGGSLHKGGWNKELRVIYNKAGCTVDKNVKKHNLSHRLRHGFAVRRIKEDGVGVLELANDLRHKGIASVMCYWRPTEEDVYEANTLGAEKMIADNPNLKNTNGRTI